MKKKRVKSFEMFKESYLVEQEEAMPELDGMGDDLGMEDEVVPSEDELDTPELEDSEDSEEGSELYQKVCDIVDEQYSETLEDMIKGICGELEDVDPEECVDAILDCLEEKVEAILMSSGEDSEEDSDEESNEEDSEGGEEDLEVEGGEEIDMAEEEENVESTESIEEEEEVSEAVKRFRNRFKGKLVTEKKKKMKEEEEGSVKSKGKESASKLKHQGGSEKDKTAKADKTEGLENTLKAGDDGAKKSTASMKNNGAGHEVK